MAKVIMPFMSAAARGKLGPLVANQWRGFNTMKLFRSPTQPNTAAQLAARSRMATFSSAWAALSAVQRAAWQTYAIDHLETDWTGNPKRLTSQNWFVRCNTRINLVGGVQINTPPVATAPAAPSGLVLACAGGAGTAMTITWTTPTSANSFMVVYHAGPLSAGRIPRFEQAAILIKPASNAVHPYTAFAAAVAGRHGFWVQVVDSLTGLASHPIFAEITVA